ncbi:Narbonolide/10-deoxymethynolide synthase PikA2, modules 3 and 4 [Mycobacterium attenuatum]|uniref:Narbonolide/10-deoxymethynolide synthase PikA2, modules 3 and 4 n=1 Tax=Mycobacterium attenuatum TaxID=2341086 RepID=A0A498QGW3_9MYCO|nr:Narbonolide/10-deoxymethynolide synthase PikA2, modules 3 and 4 [Mycobacterium attenuatum]
MLAHPDPTTIDADRPFKDLGIDSLTALELRNNLAQHTGLTLPATLVFDHPSPHALARYLIALITNTDSSSSTPALNDYAKQVQHLITSIPVNNLAKANVLGFLNKLLVDENAAVSVYEKEIDLTNMDLDDLLTVALRNADPRSTRE